MLTLYFSGTGNSQYVARSFSKKAGAICFSIEDDIDFSQAISQHGEIAFCYPIYGSRPPLIMREFAKKYAAQLTDKKIIVFCTQYMFSGDGARSFCKMLPDCKVMYAEHFFMPNNICNFFLFPKQRAGKIARCIKRADVKIIRICRDLENGIVKLRGFGIIPRLAGMVQGDAWYKMEEKARGSVRIDHSCSLCQVCVSVCPMKNLDRCGGEIRHNSRCILCYRCVNRCPQKAITVFLHTKVKNQYRGI